jgi:hypothetical protein
MFFLGNIMLKEMSTLTLLTPSTAHIGMLFFMLHAVKRRQSLNDLFVKHFKSSVGLELRHAAVSQHIR